MTYSMRNKGLKLLGKGLAFTTLGAFMMGNQGCPKDATVVERQLRRRVQMGSITSYVPQIKLPADAGSGTFNFEFAANAQLQRVLSSTRTFSTVGGFYDPSSVSKSDSAEFYKCSASNPAKAFEFSDDAACMVYQPQAKINAYISNFQFLGGAQADIGFQDFGALTGLSFNFKKARLDMEFEANDPLLPGAQDGRGFSIASVPGKSYFKDVGGKIGLDFGVFKLGLGGYMTSDMANVVEQAMTSGLSDLRTNWDTKAAYEGLSGGWHAMVMKNCDTGILINAGGGSDAGLMVGDIIGIFNVDYKWEYAICNSQLQGSLNSTDLPIAYATVTSVGDTISRARIIEDDNINYPRVDIKIRPGARVFLKKWAPVKTAAATTATK